MIVLGFMLIGLGIFIVCLTLNYEVRKVKDTGCSGIIDFIIIVLVNIVDIITDLWSLRLLFILIGLVCIGFGVAILTLEEPFSMYRLIITKLSDNYNYLGLRQPKIHLTTYSLDITLHIP